MQALKQIRLKGYNYKKDGYYFVTISTNYKKHILIGKTKDVLASLIEQLPSAISGVALDYFIIMPSHLHIILILKDCKLHLGEVVRRLKARSTQTIGLRLWQPNYYEHVIRNEKALEKIREYIRYNPEKDRIAVEKFYQDNAR